MDLSFDDAVKRQKAVDWLLRNDATVKAVAMQSRVSDVAAVLIAADYGLLLAAKIEKHSRRMTVSDEDRSGHEKERTLQRLKADEGLRKEYGDDN